MRHAYLIIAHNEYPVLKALLEMLDDDRNTLFLHIDHRAQPLYEKIKTLRTQKADLKILSNRISVYWGDISQVEVEYLLLETALQQGTFDYYHLLSGVDLPLKSQQQIHQFFDEHQGKEFVSFWNSPAHQKDLDRKVSYRYYLTKYRRPGEKWHALATPFFNLLLIIQKVFGIRRNKEIEFQKGSQWFSITHAFAQYLIQQKKWALKRFRYTLCPDEIFVQTVLWNSPFKEKIYNLQDELKGNMRLIDWKRGHPYVWKNEDLNELLHSPMLFARKFTSQQLDVIEGILQENTHKGKKY